MPYNQFVAWGEESGSWASEASRDTFARPYEDSKLMHEKPQAPLEYLSNRDPEAPFYQAERGVGNLVFPLTYTGAEIWLKHCVGNIATSGSGPYDHTFSLDNNPYTRSSSPLLGLSIELNLGLPDSGYESALLLGARCRSFGSNFRVNEETKLSSEWVGQKVMLEPITGSPSFPDYDHASASPLVKWSQIALTIDAGSETVYGVEFTCNNNLRDDRAKLGSQYIAEPRAQGRREITGTLDLEWSDKTLYDKFVSGASAAILATATGPGSFAMTVRFNNVRFTGETPGLSHGEDVDYSLPFTAYDDATYGAMQIVNTNDTAAP